MIAHKNKNKFVTTIKTNIMHDILFYTPLRSRFLCITNGILFDEQKSIENLPCTLSFTMTYFIVHFFYSYTNIFNHPKLPRIDDHEPTI